MIVSYRYRLLPAKRQHRALELILESQRELYNAALEERIGAYRKAGLTRTYFDQCKALTEWRRGDPEASALPVNLQRATLWRLDEAYRGFFRRVAKGGLKRDTKGWTISFAVEVASNATRRSDRTVGVDLGISTFAALSDGGFIPSLRAARKAERRLRVAQRALSRKQRGSGGRRVARTAVARCHAAVARQRTEHLHQASARLVRDYDAIVVEELNVKGLAASHDCSHCGQSIDRDLNAARNVLNRAGVGLGLRNVAGSCGMRAGENLGSALRPRQEPATPN